MTVSNTRNSLRPISRRINFLWQSLFVSALFLGCAAGHCKAQEISPADSIGNKQVILEEKMLIREPFELDNTAETDSILTVVTDEKSPYGLDGKIKFNPSPTRAVWMSALFPGLGQIYNRRYWKLPIVVGGFMGLTYATNWNNNQLLDYTQAYRDLTDSDPDTNSYMNFFPPTTTEDSLDKSWLTSVVRTRRDYYRRNRDLCIICLVGMYLLCMIDAYVDASLAHFDISDNLSMDLAPTLMPSQQGLKPGVGLNWAFTF